MKKLFVTISLALISLGAFAQKGEQNIGAYLLHQYDLPWLEGIGFKYQINVTNVIRLEAVYDYYPDDGLSSSMYDFNINGHYLFNLTDKFIAYPFVGVNYTHFTTGLTGTISGFAPNIGGGIQYKLKKFRIGAELKCQYLNNEYYTSILGIGVTYTL